MLNVKDDEDVMCYLGRCVCGGIMFATVDTPDRRATIAADIADVIAHGFTIERATVATARTSRWCTRSKQHMRERKG